MFTGLIETLGTVRELTPDGTGGCRLTVAVPFAGELTVGESIAVNGACLTVVACDSLSASFELGPETLARTNLGLLALDDAVNLERALRVGDRLGGHFVQGHIDGVGVLRERRTQGEWEFVRFQSPPELLPLLVPKGSIAIDGISLTIVDLFADGFSVMLIPHTLAVTTLGRKREGAPVNLEADLLAKHVARLLGKYPA